MKGSINSQVYYIINQISAIGVSKRDTRSNSSVKGQNGRLVSDKVHSYKYKNDIKNTANQLGNFSFNYGVKNMEKISNEMIYVFLKDKIEKGLSFRSASTYISHLAKISIGLESIAISKGKMYKGFNSDGLKAITNYKVKHAIKTKKINRAYKNPQLIISNLQNIDHKIVAKAQLEGGVRVAEALRFRPDQLKGNDMLEVRIKGGKRLIVCVDENTYKEIELRVNNAVAKGEVGHIVNYKDYYKDLKEAVLLSNEIWTSTHGLRYTYAQRRMAELSKAGVEQIEAQRIVSQELGHYRPDVLHVYTASDC